MAIGGGMSCVKYLLFCFNLLFAITGLFIIGIGAYSESHLQDYLEFTNLKFYTSAPVVLILVGIVITIVAFFGCCGAIRENHCMIITFSVFLLIIFIAELAVGIAGFVTRGSLHDSIEGGLNTTMPNYYKDKEMQHVIDIMQTDLKCCGVNSPAYWQANNMTIPTSCCSVQEVKDNKTVSCDINSPDIHKEGCVAQLIDFFHSTGGLLGGVGLGIAIVQLMGVIFACALARSIRSQYETV